MASGFSLEVLKHKDSIGYDKFQCGKCKQLLRNPHQGLCGHRYCKECLSELESSPTPQLCFVCKEEDANEEECYIKPGNAFPDNAIKREMSTLDVHCAMADCSWEGKYKDLDGHLASCSFVPVICSSCGNAVQQAKLQEHLRSKCGTVDLEAFKCPLRCPDVLFDQVSLNSHVQERLPEHLKMLYNQIFETDSRLNKLIEDVRSNNIHSNKSNRNIQSNDEDDKLSNLEAAVVVLSRELSYFHDKIPDLEKKFNKMETELTKFQSLERLILSKDAEIMDLKVKITCLESTSYDGSLLWRVEEFAHQRERAKNGGVTSIYSPPFFSSRTGYKMCARLYLNGDGVGKGEYISLFFVLMRGAYDAMLPWPFDQQVTFMMLDQSGGMDHVRDTFKPDPSSSSFKRPSTNMNIASGCPMFMPLTKLDSSKNKYVKDDVAFVKIIVKSDQLDLGLL